MNKQAPTFK